MRGWCDLLPWAIERGEVVRVRHRYLDGPALLVSEKHDRELERSAGGDPLLALLRGASDAASRSPEAADGPAQTHRRP